MLITCLFDFISNPSYFSYDFDNKSEKKKKKSKISGKQREPICNVVTLGTLISNINIMKWAYKICIRIFVLLLMFL